MSERISKADYYLGIAYEVSKRSTCLKRHYGCVIVNNDEIIATGYNGAARGEENCCDKEECPRINMPHNSGDYSDCPAVHAEQNAMISAARRDMIGATMYLACRERRWSNINQSFFPWRAVVNPEPCPICMRMIKNSGIAKIVNNGGVVWEKT